VALGVGVLEATLLILVTEIIVALALAYESVLVGRTEVLVWDVELAVAEYVL
jgi:hypothetical protein